MSSFKPAAVSQFFWRVLISTALLFLSPGIFAQPAKEKKEIKRKEEEEVLKKKKNNAFMDMERIGDKEAEKLQPKVESKHLVNVKFGKQGGVKKVKDEKKKLPKKAPKGGKR